MASKEPEPTPKPVQKPIASPSIKFKGDTEEDRMGHAMEFACMSGILERIGNQFTETERNTFVIFMFSNVSNKDEFIKPAPKPAE